MSQLSEPHRVGTASGTESLGRALSRGLLGAVVLAVAIGVAMAVGEVVHDRLGIGGTARQVVHALVTSCIVVPVVLLLLRRDGRSLADVGLLPPRRGLATFGLGVMVTAGAAAVLFSVGTVAGWLSWGSMQVTTLLGYLAVTVPIAVLYEALPEELALRGYTYGSLRVRLRRWPAAIVTTALFLLVPGMANVVHAGLGWMTTEGVRAPAFVPEGEDPVAYLVLLAVFGMVLAVARITTGSVWTPIGLHLTFLLVNRVTLFGDPDVTGWAAEPTHPDVILLVPGYLVVAAVVLVVVARVGGRRSGWRERGPGERRPG